MTSYGRGEFDGFSSYQTGNASSKQAGSGGMGEFGRLVNSVSNNIQKITQNVAQMQTNVNKIGTQQDTPELRERVHHLQHHTNQIAKETNIDLKELAHLPMPSSEQGKWKMQKERLTDEFSTALKNFQTIQRTAAEKEKASVARARAHSSGRPTFDDDMGNDSTEMTPGFSKTRQILQMEEDVDLQMIQERENSIKQLERDITDVNQIFKDLGMMVHEQGEMLDSIEANVENAQVRVEEGTKQLGKAVTYQSKARRKKCICVIIVVLILLVIGIIVAVEVSKNSS